MVVSAGSPAEEVDPAVIGFRNVCVVSSNVIILVVGKPPGIGGGLVLKITLREIHLGVLAYGEYAVDGTYRRVVLRHGISQTDEACQQEYQQETDNLFFT